MLMKPNYKAPFARYVRKSHKPLQLAIEDAVEEICKHPKLGELKVGDLAGIRVYKFRFNRQEFLVAYRLPAPERTQEEVIIEWLWIDFYQVGLHENFYDELKRYLKSEGQNNGARNDR